MHSLRGGGLAHRALPCSVGSAGQGAQSFRRSIPITCPTAQSVPGGASLSACPPPAAISSPVASARAVPCSPSNGGLPALRWLAWGCGPLCALVRWISFGVIGASGPSDFRRVAAHGLLLCV
eukprot:14680217-Alexandrium_andersonii.AAC.1